MELVNAHIKVSNTDEVRVLGGDEGQGPLLILGDLLITAESKEAADVLAACANAFAKCFRPTLVIAEDESRIERYARQLVAAIANCPQVMAAYSVPDNGRCLTQQQIDVRHALTGLNDALGHGEAQR